MTNFAGEDASWGPSCFHSFQVFSFDQPSHMKNAETKLFSFPKDFFIFFIKSPPALACIHSKWSVMFENKWMKELWGGVFLFFFFFFFSFSPPHNFVYIDERKGRASCNISRAALYESSQEVGHTLEIKLP